MADDSRELRRINWSECFPFVHLFRAIRVAANASQIILALVALSATYGMGRLLDVVWNAADAGVIYGEATEYGFQPDFAGWHEARQAEIQRELAGGLVRTGAAESPDAARRDAERDWDRAVSDIREKIDADLAALTNDKARQDALTARTKDLSGAEKLEAEEKFDDEWPAQVAELRQKYIQDRRELSRLSQRGIFDEFLRHEVRSLRSLLAAARMFQIWGGFEMFATQDAAAVGRDNPAVLGVVGSLVMMAQGVLWLVREHWLYAILFLGFSLCVWAILGGAICRIAALQIARNEATSMTQALRFAWIRKLSLISAPLLPVAIVLAFGFLLAAGGFVASIPYANVVTSPLLALGFGLALLAGAIIAFMTIGFIAGGALMWPTIGAEGSDFFDAISRSYSYVVERPWSMILYALVAIIYGAFWYLLIGLFVWLTLASTHAFIGLGSAIAARPELGPGMTRIDALWTAPTLDNLRPTFEWVHVSGWESVSAIFVTLWVYLLIGAMYAFMISYYYSAGTIIYFLLRREADATDLDDVYPDDFPDEPLEFSPPPGGAAAGSGPEKPTHVSLPIAGDGNTS